jgi:hypothetical protein
MLIFTEGGKPEDPEKKHRLKNPFYKLGSDFYELIVNEESSTRTDIKYVGEKDEGL